MAKANHLERKLQRAVKEIPGKALQIMEVEGLSFIKKNFRDQGFNDGGLKRWQPRKTTDKRGRDITRYRTNRVGRAGNLNRYGSKIKGRPVLTGHNTGGNKLRNSFLGIRSSNKVELRTHKEYAEVHNEGEGNMPQRQFIGDSPELESAIKAKVIKELDKIFK